MNHNTTRFYVFMVNHKGKLQLYGNIEGYTDYSEVLDSAQSLRKPSKYGTQPVVYILRTIPMWKFDDDHPQGVRIQEET